MDLHEKLESLLIDGDDSAVLRFGIASSYLKKEDFESACLHLEIAIKLDPSYSAAWKLLGKAQTSLGLYEAATDTYTNAISIAKKNGDIQSTKEMKVFLSRLKKLY
ncbi:MAG: hypothetical protein CBC38_02385 [Gammaproteobacteria bacterium TMED78]|nr:MAG: hypothetical protein CBC38_02385 [Gammaproteobacteria bacterium TMED78]|tara:strand:- start:140 stop:457 length:318 start_codon:yes stop_codon:yes gene_type:complete